MDGGDWIMLGVLAFAAMMSFLVCAQDHFEGRKAFPNNPALW